MNFSLHRGSALLTLTLFKGQLYFQHSNWSTTLKIHARFTEGFAMAPLSPSHQLPQSISLPILPSPKLCPNHTDLNTPDVLPASSPLPWRLILKIYRKLTSLFFVLPQTLQPVSTTALLSCSTFSFLYNVSPSNMLYIFYLLRLLFYFHSHTM